MGASFVGVLVSVVSVLVAPTRRVYCLGQLLAAPTLPVVLLFVFAQSFYVPFAPQPRNDSRILNPLGFGDLAVVQPANERAFGNADPFSHFRRGVEVSHIRYHP